MDHHHYPVDERKELFLRVCVCVSELGNFYSVKVSVVLPHLEDIFCYFILLSTLSHHEPNGERRLEEKKREIFGQTKTMRTKEVSKKCVVNIQPRRRTNFPSKLLIDRATCPGSLSCNLDSLCG
jgi:hypothetical protein